MTRQLICTVRRGSLHAELRTRGRPLWAAEAEWTDLGSLTEMVASLAGRAELPAWGRAIRFVLAPELVQRRDLADLPPIGRRQLAALVALTPGRYFRKNGTPLVTDAGWSRARDRRVGVAVASEVDLLRALVAGAGEAGLAIDAIEACRDVRGAPLTLLPPDEQLRRSARETRWTRRLAAAALIAWGTLGVSLLAAHEMERRRIEARLQEIGPSVRAVLAAESAADSIERMVARLEDESMREGEVVASLYRVALALPDSSFLTQLRVDSAEVGLLAGAARRPAAMLAALEGRAGLTAPRFSGRTTPDQILGRPVERFAIGFGTREVHR